MQTLSSTPSPRPPTTSSTYSSEAQQHQQQEDLRKAKANALLLRSTQQQQLPIPRRSLQRDLSTTSWTGTPLSSSPVDEGEGDDDRARFPPTRSGSTSGYGSAGKHGSRSQMNGNSVRGEEAARHHRTRTLSTPKILNGHGKSSARTRAGEEAVNEASLELAAPLSCKAAAPTAGIHATSTAGGPSRSASRPVSGRNSPENDIVGAGAARRKRDSEARLAAWQFPSSSTAGNNKADSHGSPSAASSGSPRIAGSGVNTAVTTPVTLPGEKMVSAPPPTTTDETSKHVKTHSYSTSHSHSQSLSRSQSIEPRPPLRRNSSSQATSISAASGSSSAQPHAHARTHSRSRSNQGATPNAGAGAIAEPTQLQQEPATASALRASSRIVGRHLRDTTEQDEPVSGDDDALEGEGEEGGGSGRHVFRASTSLEKRRSEDVQRQRDTAGEEQDEEEEGEGEDDKFEKYVKILPMRDTNEENEPAIARLERIKKQNDAKRFLGVKSPFKRKTKKLQKQRAKEESDSDVPGEPGDLGRAYEGVKLRIAALPGVNIIGHGVNSTAHGVAGIASSAGRAIVGRRDGGGGSVGRNSGAPTRQNTALNVVPAVQKHTPNTVGMLSCQMEEGGLPYTSSAPSAQASKAELPIGRPDAMQSGKSTPTPSLINVPPRRPHSAEPQKYVLASAAAGVPMESPATSLAGPPSIIRPNSTGAMLSSKPRRNSSLLNQSPYVDESDTSISDGEGYDEEALVDSDQDSDDDRAEAMLAASANRLELQHGKGAVKQNKRRRRLAKLLSESKRKRTGSQADLSEPIEDDDAAMDSDTATPAASSQQHHQGGHSRAGSVGHHVSRGLTYASGKSRNRRAMEKYSPAPNKLIDGSGQTMQPSNSSTDAFGSPILRNNTRSPAPGSGLKFAQSSPVYALAGTPADSSNAEVDGIDVVLNGLENGVPPRAYSPSILSEDHGADPDAQNTRFENFLQRWNTHNTVASQGSVGRASTIRGLLRGSQRLFTKGKRKDTDAVSIASAQQNDPEKELDNLIGQALDKADPSDVDEKLEYDILYENQRGLQVFGVPRYSSRVLFVGDPAPWTSGTTGHNVAYTVANAQLPDPSWEWVNPEWMIDMSGDVDEAGWHYSGDFGQKYYRALRKLPNAAGLKARGSEKAEQHLAKKAEKQAKREQKQNEKEDDGLEALKRTALARQAKWRGTSDPWTFVRRRRWIRLRRRRALVPKQSRPRTDDQARNAEAAAGDATIAAAPARATLADLSSQESDTESGVYGPEDSSSMSSEDDDVMWASANGAASGFLPRQVAGNLQNHGDPLELRRGKGLARQRRHAKEFTGSIRELKSLLPAIIDPRKAKHLQKGQAYLRQGEIDARNPFISWKLVKRRLADADLTWVSANLRTLERKFQQRLSRKAAKKNGTSRPPLAQAFDGHIKDSTVQTLEEAVEDEEAANQTIVNVQPEGENRMLTRDALIEINYRRVVRVLRACKVDRQKLELWRLWLGVDSMQQAVDEPLLEDLRMLGLAAKSSNGHESAFAEKRSRALNRWRAMQNAPDPVDVWDVLERRLDQVMLLFEFQTSRTTLIKLLIRQHAVGHPGHVVHDRFGGMSIPAELHPQHERGSQSELGDGYHSIEAQPWREAALPRLQFWSDLYGCAPEEFQQNAPASTPPRSYSAGPAPLLAYSVQDAPAGQSGADADLISRPFSAPPAKSLHFKHLA